MRLVSSALVVFLLLSRAPAFADSYADCVQSTDPDRRIRACTMVLKRGKRESRKDRFVTYTNRGVAYVDKGQYDRAIADFDQAIRLNPATQVSTTSAELSTLSTASTLARSPTSGDI
jgi:tetratricopeptide (TPR) repeat protein